MASPHLGPPPFDASYTLAEILLHSDSLQTRYRHRHLAVRFFMENHRDFVDVAVGHLRRGEFDAYQDFLNGGVARYSEAWGTWLRAGDANVQPEIVQPIQREMPYFLVPMFPAHTEGGRQGWVRVVNLSDRDGDVDIVAVDDGGNRFEPTTLRLRRGAATFDSHDLENGNAEKGLPQGVGSGTGDWRLELRTALDILVLGYIRTPGFVVPMTDIASRHRGGYLVPTFYPGRNTFQRSSLRIGNLGGADAEVTISGVDDAGIDSSEVKTRIGGFATVTFSAKELEEGARGLDGDLGRGLGKWRLFVSSPNPIYVMSLLESSRGHLVNLSTLPAANDVPGKGTMSFVPTNGAND